MRSILLSPSTLNLYLACPRCFWLEKNKGARRPRGIFPSLPGGMDLVIKAYFDRYRLKGELPKEIKGEVKGKLFSDLTTLEKWRNWKLTNLRYEDKLYNVVLTGALDDCIVEDNLFIPLDYKTRGSDLKDDSVRYYQSQLECYCLMLESSGYKTKGLAYLLFFWPNQAKDDGIFEFQIRLIKIKTDIESAKKLVKEAVSSLMSPIPKSNPECEYCNFIKTRIATEQ